MVLAGTDMRHFACTSCGKCCDRGPEMELSEATALAGTFITSLIFKVESLPIGERSQGAMSWWQRQGSRIPLRPALDEARRHLSLFASRRRPDRHSERQLFLTISAIVEDDGRGRCPALAGNLCAIYDTRPLTCRTVPMHYSRPPSALGTYLDRFAATPHHQCDVSDAAPTILDGNKVLDPAVRQYRDDAIAMAKNERAWKERMLLLMDDPARACAARLPTYDAVLANSENGFATMLPMIVAWRVARGTGLLSGEVFQSLCRQQASLIKAEIARSPGGPHSRGLSDTLALYEATSDAPGTEAAPAFANPLFR